MKSILTYCFLAFSLTIFSQVGIGTTTPQGALDIDANNQGIVVPRVALTASNVATPVVNPQGGALAAGTLVWNTATAGTAPNNVIPGFYFWDGTNWRSLADGGGRDWSINGNAGTIATTNFLGSTDNVGIRIRTNNSNRFEFSNNGRLRSFDNGTAGQPTYSWNGDADTGMWRPAADHLAFSTNGVARLGIVDDGRVTVNGAPLFTSDRFTSIGNTDQWAVNGYATGSGRGVYGSADLIGVQGEANLIGVQGIGTANSSYGVRGIINTYSNGIGVLGQGLGPNGTGVFGDGTNIGVRANGSLLGIFSESDDTSIYAIGSVDGIIGQSSGNLNFPVWGINTGANGSGIIGLGNNQPSAFVPTLGAGIAATGLRWGVYSIVNTSTNSQDRAAFYGQYNSNGTTQQNIYVGARIGGTHYKILGSGGGSVSTTMNTREGERILFAPEAPENWFFDLGEVQLVNGRATVQLDPLFVDCISDIKPFKVFVQGAEDVFGMIKVKRNQELKTFELEDSGGASTGIVQFKIYGIWKNKENVRFPVFVNPDTTEEKSVKNLVSQLPEVNNKSEIVNEENKPRLDKIERANKIENSRKLKYSDDE